MFSLGQHARKGLAMLYTVSRSKYAAFVKRLPDSAKWNPIETISQCVMQVKVDGELMAQAIYRQGIATINDGVISGVKYQISTD